MIRPIYDSIFEEEFPSLYKKIRSLNSLATELQIQESKIFVPVATSFSDRGCLSVHDGLYFKSEIKEDLLIELESSFKKEQINNYKLSINIIPLS